MNVNARLCVVSVSLAAFLFLAGPISAATIDGTVSIGEYGSPLAVQDTPTGYGDTDGASQFGSELNALYGNYLPGGGLELAFTGNLEDGTGNSLVILLDVRAGGAVSSTLSGGYGQLGSFGGQRTDDWGNDVDGGPGETPTPGGSSILDPGFDPDISIEVNAGGNFGEYFVNIIDMTLLNDDENMPDADQFLGLNSLGSTAVMQIYTRDDADTDKGSGGAITHAFDNSNTAGVLGYNFGDPPGTLGDPLSATTGIELHLSSEFVAADHGQQIKLLPFISNQSGEFLSNQFLPGLDGVANLDNPGGLGGVPLFDAREFTGDQFITIEPILYGDYNDDGTIDAADYTVWRDALEAEEDELLNDPTPGEVDETDYDFWRENFGDSFGSGSGSIAGDRVPEPTTLTMLLLGAMVILSRRGITLL